MKKLSTFGVTLLEIMLVLAIAAMVIVMSVRYYQTSSANQQANAVLSMIQAIQANADALAQESGKYNGGTETEANTANIKPMMPNNSMTAPWGGDITVTGATATTYQVDITEMPTQVCSAVRARLVGNPKYTGVSSITCPDTGTIPFTFVYNKTA